MPWSHLQVVGVSRKFLVALVYESQHRGGHRDSATTLAKLYISTQCPRLKFELVMMSESVMALLAMVRSPRVWLAQHTREPMRLTRVLVCYFARWEACEEKHLPEHEYPLKARIAWPRHRCSRTQGKPDH